MATKTWTGLGADNNWSTNANWSGGTKPATTDDVIFDETSSKNCDINNVGTWSGGTLTIQPGYNGQVAQLAALVVTTFTQQGGTFLGGAASIQSNTVNITGGFCTATSGTWTLNGLNPSFSVGAGVSFFDHNGGTILFSSYTGAATLGSNGGWALNLVRIVGAPAGSDFYIVGQTNVETFRDNDGTSEHTLIFEDQSSSPGLVHTFNEFLVAGAVGNNVNLESLDPGNEYVMHGVGSPIVCDYLTITDSHVDVSPTWTAGANSTNGGGNTNWLFDAPPVSTAKPRAFYLDPAWSMQK